MQALAAPMKIDATGLAAGPGRCQRRRNGPAVLLVALIALSVLIQAMPAAQAWMQFDRRAIGAGQWWRLLTGNLVHYDWVHMCVNVGAFALLGWMALGRSRRAMWVIPISAAAIGAGVYVWAGGIATYRGISGMTCALLSWMLVVMAIEDRGWKAVFWLGVLALNSAKYIFEMVTGAVLLPTSAPPGVDVVGVTHVVGIATGAVFGLFSYFCGLWRVTDRPAPPETCPSPIRRPRFRGG